MSKPLGRAAKSWGDEIRVLYQDGGPPGGDDPMERLARLETKFDALDKRLERIEDKIPSKWDMAQVVFYVVGGLMAAAIFGPRLAAMIPPAG